MLGLTGQNLLQSIAFIHPARTLNCWIESLQGLGVGRQAEDGRATTERLVPLIQTAALQLTTQAIQARKRDDLSSGLDAEFLQIAADNLRRLAQDLTEQQGPGPLLLNTDIIRLRRQRLYKRVAPQLDAALLLDIHEEILAYRQRARRQTNDVPMAPSRP